MTSWKGIVTTSTAIFFFSLIPDLKKQQSKKIELNETKQKNINRLLNELILNTHILLSFLLI